MPLELWQAEIRETVFGAGTSKIFTGPIGGLGIPVPRSADLDRHEDGVIGSDDPLPRRILTFPMGFEGDTAGEAWAEHQAMKSAWRPSPVDIPLGLRLPGMVGDEGLLFYGRPRGFETAAVNLKSGHVDALLTFEALDPIGYGPTETYGPGAGPFTVDNVGDATVDVVLSIVGDGGTPEITNADDGGKSIAFDGALAGAEVRTLSTKDRTNLDGDFDLVSELSPGTQWFRLPPGENEISLDGAASLTITFRPGYY